MQNCGSDDSQVEVVSEEAVYPYEPEPLSDLHGVVTACPERLLRVGVQPLRVDVGQPVVQPRRVELGRDGVGREAVARKRLVVAHAREDRHAGEGRPDDVHRLGGRLQVVVPRLVVQVVGGVVAGQQDEVEVLGKQKL